MPFHPELPFDIRKDPPPLFAPELIPPPGPYSARWTFSVVLGEIIAVGGVSVLAVNALAAQPEYGWKGGLAYAGQTSWLWAPIVISGESMAADGMDSLGRSPLRTGTWTAIVGATLAQACLYPNTSGAEWACLAGTSAMMLGFTGQFILDGMGWTLGGPGWSVDGGVVRW